MEMDAWKICEHIKVLKLGQCGLLNTGRRGKKGNTQKKEEGISSL